MKVEYISRYQVYCIWDCEGTGHKSLSLGKGREARGNKRGKFKRQEKEKRRKGKEHK
jgi:hypothetical protein